MSIENSTPDAAYATKTAVGPFFNQANIVNQQHTISDALPATAKAQALTTADTEHAQKEARAAAELQRRNGGVTVTAATIAKGR